MRLIEERWAATLDADGRRAADLVLDLDAEQTTCPACLTAFSPASAAGRCPDCGLVFG